MVEQPIRNRQVASSTLALGSNIPLGCSDLENSLDSPRLICCKIAASCEFNFDAGNADAPLWKINTGLIELHSWYSKTREQLHWIIRGVRLHSYISDAGADNAWKVWRTSQEPEADPYRYSRTRLHDSPALVLGALTTIHHMDFRLG